MLPKIIHHIVFGSQREPLIDRCLSSWPCLQQFGFSIKAWNESSIDHFLQSHYSFAHEAFRHARNHAEAADIARYLVVYHEGGYYVDWDIELLDPVKFLLLHEANPFGYLIKDPGNETLAAEMFSAAKREPYLLDLAQEIIDIYQQGKRDDLLTPYYSGPYRMWDVLKRSATGQSFISVKKAFAYDYYEVRQMKSKIINQPMLHYWLHSWIKEDSFDPGGKYVVKPFNYAAWTKE